MVAISTRNATPAPTATPMITAIGTDSARGRRARLKLCRRQRGGSPPLASPPPDTGKWLSGEPGEGFGFFPAPPAALHPSSLRGTVWGKRPSLARSPGPDLLLLAMGWGGKTRCCHAPCAQGAKLGALPLPCAAVRTGSDLSVPQFPLCGGRRREPEKLIAFSSATWLSE